MKQAIKIKQNLERVETLFHAMGSRKQLVTAIYPKYFIDLNLADELRGLSQDYNTTTVKESYRAVFAPLHKESVSLVKYYEDHLKGFTHRVGPDGIGAVRLGSLYMLNYDLSTFETRLPSTDREPIILSEGNAMKITPEMLYTYCLELSSFFKQMAFTETRGVKAKPGVLAGTTLENSWDSKCELSYEVFINGLIKMQIKEQGAIEPIGNGSGFRWSATIKFAGTMFQYLIGIGAIPDWSKKDRAKVFKSSFLTHLKVSYKTFETEIFTKKTLLVLEEAYGLECGYCR